MPKKSTGYTSKPTKTNSIKKEVVPMKTPSIKQEKLPQSNGVASMPNNYRFPKLTRPATLQPKAPRI